MKSPRCESSGGFLLSRATGSDAEKRLGLPDAVGSRRRDPFQYAP